MSFNHFALENWELGTVARVQIQEQSNDVDLGPVLPAVSAVSAMWKPCLAFVIFK